MNFRELILSKNPDVWLEGGLGVPGVGFSGVMTDSSGNGRDFPWTSASGIWQDLGGIPSLPPAQNRSVRFSGTVPNNGTPTKTHAAWMDRATFTAFCFFRSSETASAAALFNRWASASASQVWNLEMPNPTSIHAQARINSTTQTAIATISLNDAVWHLAAITWDGTDLILNVDGVDLDSVHLPGQTINAASTHVMRVGQKEAGSNDNNLFGSICNLYFGPVLTEDELKEIYTIGRGMPLRGVWGFCEGGEAAYLDYLKTLSVDAAWRFGEASGTVMLDSSGNGRHGAWTSGGSAPIFGQPGIWGDGGDTAVSMTGTSTMFGSIPAAAWMNRTTSWSVGIWWRTRSTAEMKIMARWGSLAANQVFGIESNATTTIRAFARINGATRTITATVDSMALRQGDWQFLVATYDGATFTFYINGVSVGTPVAVAGTGLQTSATEPLYIGRRGDGTTIPLNGGVDGAFQGPYLTAAQVMKAYQAGLGYQPVDDSGVWGVAA